MREATAPWPDLAGETPWSDEMETLSGPVQKGPRSDASGPSNWKGSGVWEPGPDPREVAGEGPTPAKWGPAPLESGGLRQGGHGLLLKLAASCGKTHPEGDILVLPSLRTVQGLKKDQLWVDALRTYAHPQKFRQGF